MHSWGNGDELLTDSLVLEVSNIYGLLLELLGSRFRV